MKRLPKILTTADVARLLDWDTQRARRWLISTKAGHKRGGRFVTTLSQLLAHFPEVAAELLSAHDDDE